MTKLISNVKKIELVKVNMVTISLQNPEKEKVKALKQYGFKVLPKDYMTKFKFINQNEDPHSIEHTARREEQNSTFIIKSNIRLCHDEIADRTSKIVKSPIKLSKRGVSTQNSIDST